ncbi:MAG: GtrA family protein [Nocardioidaceae bacterium]
MLDRIVALAHDQRVRYLAVGATTSVLYFGTFTAGWTFLPIPYVVMTALAHLFTALVMYPFYSRFVFRSDVSWLRGFTRFYSVWLGGLAVSVVGMPLLVEYAHVPVVVSQAVTIVAVPVLAYLVHHSWTFR